MGVKIRSTAPAPAVAAQIPQIYSGTLAARPAPGTYPQIAGEPVYYWATDIVTMFQDTGVAWIVVGAEWYRRYLDTIWGHGNEGNTNLGADTIYYCPIEIPRTLTIDNIGVIHGSPAAGNFYVAIYDSVNEAPVNRLGVSASTPCAGAVQKELVALTVATLTLTPGYYFLALEADNATDQYHTINCDTVGRLPANVNNGPLWQKEVLGAYVIPPAVATPVAQDAYNRNFYMFIRVASIP